MICVWHSCSDNWNKNDPSCPSLGQGGFFMHKRLVMLYGTVTFFAMVLVLRIYTLAFSSDLMEAATTQSSYTVEICRTRGGIYDCSGQRLTETDKKWAAAVSPSVEAMEALAKGITGSRRTAVLDQLREGKPFLCSLEHRIYGDGITAFSVYSRSGRQPFAPHILGHLDYEGKGVSGIEGAFEEELSAAGEQVLVRYGVDIQQKPLEAVVPEVIGSSEPVKAGIVLTLDKDIQQLTQVIGGQMLDKGAVVVMDVDTGQIRGLASLPAYDPNNLAESLEDEDAPFLNRAFSSYNVGSTFKLAVAAAALEQGISADFTIDCVGGTEIAGRMVYCHHRAGHRQTDMERALEQSCNPYFIALGQQVGPEAILTMAEHLGFGAEKEFAKGLTSSAGNLPALRQASSPLALANLSFGQGELLATPVQIAAMVSAIANGGYKVQPELILGWTEDGSVPETEALAKQRIMGEDTAAALRHFMTEVVEEGSGSNAKPQEGGAGGKTASAQTGQYREDGSEIVHAWFAGFYPAEEPRYAIVVFAEGMESGGAYAAPVFQRICDQISLLEKERSQN